MRFKIAAREWSNVLSAANAYHDEAVINLKEKGILLRVQDESQTGLYNTLIPKDLLEVYEQGEHPRIGVHIDDLNDLTPKKDDPILVELDGYKIKSTIGSRSYSTPNIDPNDVASEPESVPNLDMPCKVKLDPDPIMDFIKDAYRHVHNKNAGHFFISAREEGLYLWSKKDDYELQESFGWDSFEGHSLDWDSATPSDGMPGDPVKEMKMSAILSIPLTKDMEFFSDAVRLELGHGMPLKMVSESDNGVKHSWIVPPRFPREEQVSEIPERVINTENVS